jgi:hypothetical protein
MAAVLVVALAGSTAAGFLRDAAARSEVQQDQSAIALLTSTETTADRLVPVAGAGLPAEAHGHWFHQAGTPTQVIVGEFLPPLSSGEKYVAWQLIGASWQRSGELDQHSRLIMQGSDGQGVSAVEITRESARGAQPAGQAILRYPG